MIMHRLLLDTQGMTFRDYVALYRGNFKLACIGTIIRIFIIIESFLEVNGSAQTSIGNSGLTQGVGTSLPCGRGRIIKGLAKLPLFIFILLSNILLHRLLLGTQYSGLTQGVHTSLPYRGKKYQGGWHSCQYSDYCYHRRIFWK